MHHNVRDVMIEVTHGPCLLDNNVFASPCTFQQFAQGTALVHNLIAGRIDLHRVMDRSTPYHFPHTTEVAGCAFVSGGDDRYYNNVFTQPDGGGDCPGEVALGAYAGYPTSMEEYVASIHKAVAEGLQGGGDPSPVQPLYVGGNAYCGVPVAEQERDVVHIDAPLTIAVEESDDGPVVSVEVPAALASERVPIVGTAYWARRASSRHCTRTRTAPRSSSTRTSPASGGTVRWRRGRSRNCIREPTVS